jgi:tetratricopeptide (TPR) repeat protein
MEKMQLQELAERYVVGYLSPDEKEWFEKELLLNSELNKEVELLKGISIAIKDQDLLEFRDMVQEEAAEYKLSRKGRQLRTIFIRASAAAASIILIAATFFVLSIQGHRAASSIKVFSEYYNPYQSGLVFRSASGEDNLYDQAIRLYSALQYKSASLAFDSILFRDPDNNGALFFSGLACMELKDYKKASSQFEKIIDNSNSLYVQQAEWYRGLSLLAVNDRKNAIVQFRKLASMKGYYTAKARLVLNELKEK